MSSGNDFDEELARRFRVNDQVSGEQTAADAVALEHRAQANANAAEDGRQREEARRREVESDWERSRGAREWAARSLTAAHAPTRQFVIHQHLETKRKLFGKEQSLSVIDEAVNGWLVKDGEKYPNLAEDEVRRAIYGGGDPIIWQSTYLLTDANIAITFVDAARHKDDVTLRYHHYDKGMPSEMLVPRIVRVISSAAELAHFVQAAPTYRLPDMYYFTEAANKAGPLAWPTRIPAMPCRWTDA